jgi:outer membrane immunogenic protein
MHWTMALALNDISAGVRGRCIDTGSYGRTGGDMKLLVSAAVVACCYTTMSAGAADMRAVPVKASPVATASWTGFYLGLDAGTQSTRTDLTTASVTSVGPILGSITLAPEGANTLPYDGVGFRIGTFGGLNWQVSPQWVLGIEADFGWADNETTLGGVAVPGLFCCASAGHSSSVRTTWDVSVRTRLGYLVTPTFLVYATGGVAWQHFEDNASCGPPVCGTAAPGLTFVPYSFTNAFTKTGWTVGGGGEAMLWPNWFLRASYRYSDFGTVTFSNTNVVTGGGIGPTFITSTLDQRLRTHTASLGIAYKFGGPGAGADAADTAAAPIRKAAIYKAPPVAPASWKGFYLGLDGGLRSTRTDVTTTSAFVDGVPTDLANFATSAPLNKSSFRFGPYAGYNWQVAPHWVVGIEGDWGWANRTASLPGFPFTPGFVTSGIATDALSVKTAWDASARGRIGHLVTPAVLAYMTGGAAWLHYEVTSACPGLCALPLFSLSPAIITSSATKAGWTIGGGVESLWWGGWLARAEYRYADFGTESFTLTRTGGGLITSVVDNFDVKIRTHTATVGLAYKFAD